MVWEAHKCYIRGSLVKIGSRLKKERSAQILKLLNQIGTLERAHKRSLAVDVGTELVDLRRKLRDLTFGRAKADLARCRRTFYELGNKPGKILARALRIQRARSFIPHIDSPTGTRHVLSTAIADEFQKYYTGLYNLAESSSHTRPSALPTDISAYIQASGLPSLPQLEIESLEMPISEEELDWALKTSQPNKAPGPDGFTTQYYKAFFPSLKNHFVTALNALTDTHHLPPDALRAHITVIPKEGKDPTLCQNYRPISLLNTDIKLFAKILANRLVPRLLQIIHLDQVGFMPSREARDNTIRAVNLIHHVSTHNIPCMLLSTDAEKAFDRVSWPFIRAVLEHVGLGPNMRSWVDSLYSSPSASVTINGVLSPPFPITNGTRQGCPLSPLIFILTLEPLLRTLRACPDISGVEIGGHQHKVAAYADDLLFFLTSPQSSLPNLLRELDKYAVISNYKINLQKSEALNISLPPHIQTSLERSFPFRWSPSSLKYLGIKLTSNLQSLYQLNFPPLLEIIKKDLDRWQGGTFTWFGRCAIVKMNILPRLLYILQTLPIRVPPSFFKSFASALTSFIWARRAPRIAKSTLYLPKRLGGLGLPNLYLYYVASHLTRVVDWHRHSATKLWVTLEGHTSPIPLSHAPWLLFPLSNRPSHPLVSVTLEVARRTFSTKNLAPRPSPLLPVIGNPAFPSSSEDYVFRLWAEAGFSRAYAFIKNNEWLSAGELAARTDPKPLGPLRCLQLRHFLSSLPRPAVFGRGLTDFEQLCQGEGSLRGSLSSIYAMLVAPQDRPRLAFLGEWERDLGISLTTAQESRVFHFTHTASISTRYQESGYKLLSRWYRVPTRLHRIFPAVSPLCWRGCGGEGSLLHIFWGCPKVASFWREIHRIASKFSDVPLPFSPTLFLLHLSPISLKSYKGSVVRHLVNAARACIPALWRCPEAPTVSQWLRRVDEIFLMEDLTAQLNHRQERFSGTWFHWMEFVETAEYKSLRGS